MKTTYPNLDSARRPVPHDALIPALLPPKNGLAALADKVKNNSDKECTLDPSTAQQILCIIQKKV